ncbi:hypothetical protein CPB84DRAFT_1670496 [Gymnopilus junonius]|uniref:Uncharacterized protein n=1 Tax=Gymnopilus junonius TaxID=109634 RepID=A0A9P5TTU1_GYMJU|nr:hypothetical protein CPB84DRAFT_1670496 [Gymnopilus junonius]
MEYSQYPLSEDDIFSSKDASTRYSSSSRVQFPNESASTSSRPFHHRSERQKPFHSGLAPPIRRGSPLNPQNANLAVDSRRRPDSSEMPILSPDQQVRHRRNTSSNLGALPRPEAVKDSNAWTDNEVEYGMFLDEYDLDPRILQDVQRALKLKARREARMKRESATTSSTPASPRNFTPQKLPVPSTLTASPVFPRSAKSSASSDVDFSPSTGVYDLSHAHPVPFSVDNGRTLDWTSSSHSEDGDRRWMGIGKKKDKDKIPPLGLVLGQQEQTYEARLVKMKNSLSSQTYRKADITRDQLGRRYSLIYERIENTGKPLNLAAVTRWYGSHEEVVRSSLEKTEPFAWLKHLDKRTNRSSRSRWFLSALILEEYVRSDGHHDRTEELPKANFSVTPQKSSSPSLLSSSRRHAHGSSVSMSIPADDRLSFEPSAEAKKNLASIDAFLHNNLDLTRNATKLETGHVPLSPVSTRSNDDRNLSGRSTPDHARSPGSSSSESFVGNLSAQRAALTTASPVVPAVSVRPPSSENIAAPTATTTSIPLTLTISRGSLGSSQTRPTGSAANQSMLSLKVALKNRRTRTIPSVGDRHGGRSKRSHLDRENALRFEYETKAHLLSETVTHNNRIRQFLNRISAAMRDFESVQRTAMQSQGIQKIDIPTDLLEAFGHDPSAVTGSTRRDRGWRAVEDIHRRVHKQRAVFRAFINSFTDYEVGQGCSLDDPLEGLVEALQQLEQFNEDIAKEAEDVNNLLDSVQTVHAQVKDNYNATVSHVSIVYPELSQIVALEESYKDQYQQFWDLGMDALTLLLDTVTPFWRTYGKTIGEDACDFLIIPLYRNEFTGEAKSYPIKEFPKRSVRHWFGLFVFFLLSIAVNVLQVRAAISSSLHFRLSLIPYDGVRWTALPFFWVGIVVQWLAVVFEFAIVFLQLGVITWWIGWSVNLLH